MDDVRVHTESPRPARVGALAYTHGSDIYLGPGQQEQLPHEAWHIVQQRQGRVRPTGRVGELPLNDDPALEYEADDMGRRAQTDSAHAAATDLERPHARPPIAPVIQRVISGLEAYTTPDQIPDYWVDQYLKDLGSDHEVHLYVEDMVGYLAQLGETTWMDEVTLENSHKGKHWDLVLKKPNALPITVKTREDGSCGVHAIWAIINRRSITEDTEGYFAPLRKVSEVRQAIQIMLAAGDFSDEIKGRIAGEIDKQKYIVKTGFGHYLRDALNRALAEAKRKKQAGPPTGSTPGLIGKEARESPFKVLLAAPSSGPVVPPEVTTASSSGAKKAASTEVKKPTKVVGRNVKSQQKKAVQARGGRQAGLPWRNADYSQTIDDYTLLITRTPAFDRGWRMYTRFRTMILSNGEPVTVAQIVEYVLDIGSKVEAANKGVAEVAAVWAEQGNDDAKKENLTAALKGLQSLDQLIYGLIRDWAGTVTRGQFYASFLGYLKQLARHVTKAAGWVNDRFAEFYKRERIGPGNAPELIEPEALAKANRREAESSHLPKTVIEALRGASGKKAAEPLSQVRALETGKFKDLEPLAFKRGVEQDIDLTTSSKVQQYNNWDQKSMYLDGSDWSGRIPKTHAKVRDGQKTGILLDTTYATSKDYERSWMALNLMTVDPVATTRFGLIDPNAYFEVRASDASVYERKISYDMRKGHEPRPDSEANNLAILHQEFGLDAFAAQSIADKFRISKSIERLLAAEDFVSYSDHRDALPPGNYMEFNKGLGDVTKGMNAAAVRVVREHETGQMFLTVTHYHAFSWYDAKGQLHVGKPFFEIKGQPAQLEKKETSSGPEVKSNPSTGNPRDQKDGKAPSSSNDSARKTRRGPDK